MDIEHFIKEINLLENLNEVDSFVSIPIYWENTDSIVLGANKCVIDSLKFPSLISYAGKSVYELYPTAMADHIKQHNDEVIRTEQVMCQEESIINNNGELKHYLAFKGPLYDDCKNVIGLVGTSIDITHQKEASKIFTQLVPKHQNTQNNIKISNRELDCLKLLKEGLSSKQIAVILDISKRTVEQYIDTAKISSIVKIA